MSVTQDLQNLLDGFDNNLEVLRDCCSIVAIAAPPMDGISFKEYVETLVQIIHTKKVVGAFLHALVTMVPDIQKTMQWTERLARQQLFFAQTKGMRFGVG
eukprot:TRINITY_DN14119_c0_g3_i1.p1 TRINITY_DN14119_c0_g3~~TRINITY_DN14119_c0_g3_i1.p1  ORF type:complete len:100 (+),score=2.64 TRINITY_DN14119_c0_g3_i1:232-531(+)